MTIRRLRNRSTQSNIAHLHKRSTQHNSTYRRNRSRILGANTGQFGWIQLVKTRLHETCGGIEGGRRRTRTETMRDLIHLRGN